ncbi:MAG: cytochrome c [SAR324 cluster bacterium]|nr:cytochrome c [SAR324 cluster bacterium]
MSAVPAQDNSAGIIQYRQKVMGAQSGHLGGIGQILKHSLPFKEDIPSHARAVANLAKLLPKLFPEGTGEGKTDALPKIWQDMDGFKKAAGKLEQEASKLAQVAQSGDSGAIMAQLKKTGKACGGCHKKFRQPKEKRKSWKKKK